MFTMRVYSPCAGCLTSPLLLFQGKRISNSRIKPKGDVAAEATRGGAGGLAFLRVAEGGELEGAKALREGLSSAQQAELLSGCGAASGDLLLLAAGHPTIVNRYGALSTVSCSKIQRVTTRDELLSGAALLTSGFSACKYKP